MESVLLAIPVKNCAQYLDNLMRQIDLLDYPKERLGIVFVENDSDDNSYEKVKEIVSNIDGGYCSVVVDKHDVGYKLPHTSRHVNEFQVDRLRAITEMRQYIVDNHLGDYDYLFWIDADYLLIPSDTIKELLRPKKDIIVPILYLPFGQLYDLTTCRWEEGKMLKVDELMKKYPHEQYIRVDYANAPFMVSRRTLSLVRYFPCDDGDQEGPCFCKNARAAGIESFAAMHVKITHAPIKGNQKVKQISE